MQRAYLKKRIFLGGKTFSEGFSLLFFSVIPAQPNKPGYQEQGSITCERCESSWGRGGRWSETSCGGRYLWLWQGVELIPEEIQAESNWSWELLHEGEEETGMDFLSPKWCCVKRGTITIRRKAIVLVSAGIELIFFLVAGILLCFGFSVRRMLITHWCFQLLLGSV